MEQVIDFNALEKLQNGSDIRGRALPGETEPATLGRTEAAALTAGFAGWLQEKTGKQPEELRVAVGCDSRISGPFLKAVLLQSLGELGLTGIDCGLTSTPAMFLSTRLPEMACDGAVMITASHLPYDRNGFKYFDKDGGLNKEDISDIIARARFEYVPTDPGIAGYEMSVAARAFLSQTKHEPADYAGTALPVEAVVSGKRESAGTPDIMEKYAEHLRNLITEGVGSGSKPLAGLHITVDAGNGAGGFYAKEVLEPLGADISGSRFLEPDGMFPHHVPNPENPDAIRSAVDMVRESGADLGIIFDTDVDRSAAVSGSGRTITRNDIVALAASLVADDHPGSTIVTDSITSPQLTEFLEKDLGLKHLRYRRGYRNVINKALELNAQGQDCPLAIETSGHAAFAENDFQDDGAYLAARVVVRLAQLKARGKTLDDQLAGLQEPAEAVEIRMPLTTEDYKKYGEEILASFKDWASGTKDGSTLTLEEPNYEGVRVRFADEGGKPYGWCLLRQSLHDPLLPLNVESDVEGGTDRIRGILRGFLAGYDGLDTSAL